jgi:beta-lactamase superfamily II metal-dependent hydrolase
MMRIRPVTVELLRAGPRHNQLLSPLTQYLGVCGDAAAGIVTLRYEHRDMEDRLQELSYRVVSEEDCARRNRILDRTGQEMAEILSLIPGLAGTLNSELERPGTLTHLRIVLSASELAMLPLELSKVPAGAGSSGGWLALQARVPVCITRHIRSVSAAGIQWPIEPRILFVAGPDTPFERHHDALRKAFAPWSDEEESLGDRLVPLKEATLARIVDEVTVAARSRAPFTHIHILAHGARLDEEDSYSPVGVALHDEVISGRRLATALSAVTEQGVRRPAVVTLATCESAKMPDVRTPDASVAHDLHDQGIPLVVASQFPLSVEGSVPFVERFYAGQLCGEHPLVSLYDVRLLLHSRMSGEVHDWASLVVYEAFPSDLLEQLEELRYWQTRRAQGSALKRIEALVDRPASDRLAASATEGGVSDSTRDRYDELLIGAEQASMQLPDGGPYTLECAGLRAAGQKRLAEAAFWMAIKKGIPETWREDLFSQCLAGLSKARAAYWKATKAYLGPSSELTRRKANLHWLLGQVLFLDVVLGVPSGELAWTAARLAAQIDTESPSEADRTWAYVSLTELTLLRLADEALSDADRKRYSDEALEHANRVVELLGRSSEQAATTSRQFERYSNLWGNPKFADAFERLGLPSRQHWDREHGLVPTTRRIVEVLRGPRARPARSSAARADGGGPKSTAPPPVREAASAAPAPTSALRSSRLSRGSSSAAIFHVEMLPSKNGDSLWIEYGDPQRPHRVAIDCGAESAAEILASRIKQMNDPLKLFVLTHIDGDHINGALALFADRAVDGRCEDIWFNGWRQVNPFLGVRQAEQLSKLLSDRGRKLPWNRAMTPAGAAQPASVVIRDGEPLPSFDLDGMRLTLLSPRADQLARLARKWKTALAELKQKSMLGRKPPPPEVTDFPAFKLEPLAGKPVPKDPSVANGSSIALLAELDERAVLLAGDAHADVLVKSIEQLQRERGRPGQKLKLNALKLSHHGSANATTIPLLELLDCPRYLVSSNGNIFSHPDREAIARVILHGGHAPKLYFNYRSPLNGMWGEQALRDRYGYKAEYPSEGTAGLLVRL